MRLLRPAGATGSSSSIMGTATASPVPVTGSSSPSSLGAVTTTASSSAALGARSAGGQHRVSARRGRRRRRCRRRVAQGLPAQERAAGDRALPRRGRHPGGLLRAGRHRYVRRHLLPWPSNRFGLLPLQIHTHTYQRTHKNPRPRAAGHDVLPEGRPGPLPRRVRGALGHLLRAMAPQGERGTFRFIQLQYRTQPTASLNFAALPRVTPHHSNNSPSTASSRTASPSSATAAAPTSPCPASWARARRPRSCWPAG